MGTENRTTDPPVSLEQVEGVRRYSFFQLVHLIEQALNPEARVGKKGPADKEVIRFRPEASLGFASSDVAEIEEESFREGLPPRFQVTTTFMGLYGTTSPLPIFYTEEILWKDRDEDTLRKFFDIFHHRLISLLYASWWKYRYHIQFDREGKDDFSKKIFALIGLATKGLAEKTGLRSVELIRYAGLLNQTPRSASALEGILRDRFNGVEVSLEQCSGSWFHITREQRMSLGKQNCALGQNTSLGERVYGRSGSFRLVFGPLHYSDFIRLLPGGDSWKWLTSFLKIFLQRKLGYEIELKLITKEMPKLQLIGRKEDEENKECEPRGLLGLSTWLFSSPPLSGGSRSILLSSNRLVSSS
jgi:type VI secretion system protein ImpH